MWKALKAVTSQFITFVEKIFCQIILSCSKKKKKNEKWSCKIFAPHEALSLLKCILKRLHKFGALHGTQIQHVNHMNWLRADTVASTCHEFSWRTPFISKWNLFFVCFIKYLKYFGISDDCYNSRHTVNHHGIIACLLISSALPTINYAK